MVVFDFQYKDTSQLSDPEITKVLKKITPEIERVHNALDKKYGSNYASLYLPFDKKIVQDAKRLATKKKELSLDALFVIGIGGSNLGTLAVQQALQGIYHNEENPDLKIYFVDTIDEDKIYYILHIAEELLKGGKNILINIVTKSGSTLETITIAEFFVYMLKRYKKKEFNKYVVVTSMEHSKLWSYALKNNIDTLELEQNVGGRYSVFSHVGMFPFAMMGFDLEKFQEGAASIVKACTSTSPSKNISAVSAAIQYLHYKSGKNIYDTFIFSTDLEGLGKWYRQLMGESIGKIWNAEHTKEVHEGIMPTVSIGSTDLHSVAQLYLGGPRDKSTTFVYVKENKKKLQIPPYPEFDKIVPGIQKRKLYFLMTAILRGTKIAFEKDKRPFTSITLPKKNEYYLAQYMQFRMIEMIYLAYLLDVNPFDQPSVEKYKKEIRTILENE